MKSFGSSSRNETITETNSAQPIFAAHLPIERLSQSHRSADRTFRGVSFSRHMGLGRCRSYAGASNLSGHLGNLWEQVDLSILAREIARHASQVRNEPYGV